MRSCRAPSAHANDLHACSVPADHCISTDTLHVELLEACCMGGFVAWIATISSSSDSPLACVNLCLG